MSLHPAYVVIVIALVACPRPVHGEECKTLAEAKAEAAEGTWPRFKERGERKCWFYGPRKSYAALRVAEKESAGFQIAASPQPKRESPSLPPSTPDSPAPLDPLPRLYVEDGFRAAVPTARSWASLAETEGWVVFRAYEPAPIEPTRKREPEQAIVYVRQSSITGLHWIFIVVLSTAALLTAFAAGLMMPEDMRGRLYS